MVIPEQRACAAMIAGASAVHPHVIKAFTGTAVRISTSKHAVRVVLACSLGKHLQFLLVEGAYPVWCAY